MHNLIPILITAVAIATILNIILKRINMPTVIGYIFTGAIIGTAFIKALQAGKAEEFLEALQ